MAGRNFANSRMYTGHVMPVMIDCNFVVTATNGLGITSLKGPYVQNVFMHTSTTPAVGNSNPASPNVAVTNPNPQNGIIVLQLQDIYSRLYTLDSNIICTNTGSDVKIDNAVLTPGVAYTISILGDATAAVWHALGVPAGITPALGVSFIAASAGGSGNASTSRVQAVVASSTVAKIDLIGNPNLLITPAPSASQGFGSELILAIRDYAGALVAPIAGTTISLKLMLSNSSVTIQGE